MICVEETKHVVAATIRGDQHLTTSGIPVLLLVRDASADGVMMEKAGSVSMDVSVGLVLDHAWSEWTTISRNYLWKTWIDLCEEDERSRVRMTEDHLVAFIVWLKTARERDESRVGSKSIPKYLSDVRKMHVALTGKYITPFTYLDMVVRAYNLPGGR